MRKKILVIDGSRFSRQVLRGIVADEYETLEAGSDKEALDIIRGPAGVAAVLLDVSAEKTAGYETLALIRKDAGTAGIPVVVFADKADGAEEAKALALGANDVIVRPYNAEAVKYRLRNLIGLLGAANGGGKRRANASEQLKRLTESIPGGIAMLEAGPAGIRMLYCNEGFFSFSGYDREAYQNMFTEDPLCLVLPEDRPGILEAVERLKSGGEMLCTYRCLTAGGDCRWFDLKGSIAERRGDTFIVNVVQFDVTERKEAEERLRISEELFRVAASTGERTIARYDIKSGIYYYGERKLFSLGFGEKIENVPRVFVEKKIILPECVAEYLAFYERIRSGEKSCGVNIAVRGEDGRYRWFHCDASVIFDDEGQPSQAIFVYTDITEQREKEAVYKKWQQSLRQKTPESYTLFRCNLSKDASLDAAEGALLQVRFSESATTFNSRTLEYASQYVHVEDRDNYIAALNADTLLANYYRDKRIETLEYRETLPGGLIRWRRLTIELVEYPNTTDVEAYLLYEDIDAGKTAELKAKEMAESDPLTGVLNRTAFARRMNKLLQENKFSQHILMMLDIDGFKRLNDTFGHAAGDQALIEIAKSLRSVLRHGDLLGRLGGDEFVVCLKDVPYEAAAEKKAKQICALMRRAYSTNARISASVGIAVCPRDGEDFDMLYRRADAALYSVKNAGKDNFAYFSHETDNTRRLPEKADDDVSEEAVPAAKRRMLIVDDSAINRAVLANIFKDEFIIEMAENGAAAMLRLRRFGAGISIVLLDLVMPGMDGFAVIEKIQSNVEMRSVPIIVVSGQDDRETSLRAIRCGAADFVTKPVAPDLIRLRAQSAISRAENERLRAQNGYLLLQSGEEAKYRTVLESTGTVVVEYDWVNSVFIYDHSISRHIAGKYDERRLWRILMSDMVADALDVKAMQECVHGVANDRERDDGSMTVKLKTPSGDRQWFRMRVFKLKDEFRLTSKMLLTYTNINEEVLSDEKLRFQAERDELTGLYSRAAFFEKAAEMIAARERGYYVIACFDINNFKVINDQYGSKKGDEVLKQVADIFLEGFGAAGGIVCRITADNFAVLYPASFMASRKLKNIREAASVLDGSLPPISFSIGRYVADDLSLSVSAMYDRAALAEASVKGRFDANIAQYDESMRESLLREQRVVNEMKRALEDRHFEVWLQPQYNHSTGALIGAEALVRWRHPERGLIAPGEFIPVFERNGFIYELDKYVWQESCAMLRRWLDAGRAPLPVSVNISRYDLFREDLLAVITGLVSRYRIPIDLLRLEITESAFAKSTEHIVGVVKRLIDYGFTVEIDDFGSGYSSLNTLKDVPAQVLKMDMRFLENNKNSDRGGNILESVVRMAKWLGMSVVAEGVETREQADYLKSIGCNYIQGYLYAKPMPAAEYEALARDADKEANLAALETVENLNNSSFWDPRSMDTLIFNTYVGGACIFEWYNGRIEILRANEKYAKIIGGEACTVADALSLVWEEHMDAAAAAATRDAIERTIASGDDATYEAVYYNLFGREGKTYLRTTFRAIARTANRCLLYATNENITAQREAEQKEFAVYERLQAIMDNVNNAITAVVTRGEEVEYLFANDRYYEMLGYTRAQYTAEVRNVFEIIHPDDRRRVREAVDETNATGRPAVLEYRVIRRDGREIWERNSISVARFNGIDAPVMLGVGTDITAERLAAQRISALDKNLQNMMNDMPGGFARLRVRPDGMFATEYVNENLCRLRGMSYDEIMAADGKNAIETVHPDDVASVRAAMAEIMATGETRSVKYRLKQADGGYVPVNAFGRISMNEVGESFINVYFTDLSEREKKDFSLRETLPFILSAIMRSASDLIFAKDRDLRYICCSPGFVRLTGQKDENCVIGKSDYELFSQETAAAVRASDLRLLDGGEPLSDNLEPLASGDGVPRYFTVSKFALRDTAGEILGIYGSGRDITEERTAFERLKLLINSIPGGIASYFCSPEGIKITYFSDGFCRIFGYTREEYEKISENGITNVTFAEDVPAVMAQVEALIRDNRPLDCTYRVRCKDGGYKWVNLRGGVASRHGDVCAVNTVLYDVTEAKLAQEKVLVHDQEMKLAMLQMGKMICEYDLAARTMTMPETYAALYGLPATVYDAPESIIGAGVIDEDYAALYREFFDAIRRGEKRGVTEYRERRADGSHRWERAEFFTIFDSDGRPVKAVIAAEETTERHQEG
ncbi:MAG: PAS domain-containing protein [bacterium]|nr:PAS domain-containing protein [bacterium]